MKRRSNGVWYFKKRLPGIGSVERSLGTKSRTRAHRLESMVVSLHEAGRLDLMHAWLEGDTTLAELQEHYEAGTTHDLVRLVRGGRTTLSEAIDETLDAKAADVRPATLEVYRTGLKHFLRIAHDGRVAEKLTTAIIRDFKKARHQDEGVKPQTANNDLQAVSILASYAQERGWISERPIIKRFKSAPKTIWLEGPDVAAYMANLRPAFRPLMQMLVGTGIRLGEAENLRVCDVRFSGDACEASVEDSKTPNGVRVISVPDWCADVIQARIEADSLDGTDGIFAPIPRRTVQKEHTRAVMAAGIRRDYTIHRHRDTFATSMARAGMPLGVLQHQLGHGTIQQTMKYARFHPDYNDAKPYFQKVADRLGFSPSGDRSGDTPRTALDSKTP